jgi:hypothetical protein
MIPFSFYLNLIVALPKNIINFIFLYAAGLVSFEYDFNIGAAGVRQGNS